jgi:hypothetical protein
MRSRMRKLLEEQAHASRENHIRSGTRKLLLMVLVIIRLTNEHAVLLSVQVAVEGPGLVVLDPWRCVGHCPVPFLHASWCLRLQSGLVVLCFAPGIDAKEDCYSMLQPVQPPLPWLEHWWPRCYHKMP